MKRSILAIAVAGFGLAACSHQTRYLTKDKQIKDVWSSASDATFIRTIGVGSAPDDIRDTTRRRGLARNAALVSSRTEMVALLKGVRIRGSIDVSRLVEQKDNIRQLVDRIIAGAEEEQVEFDKNDGAVVVLRIERSKVEDMLKETARAEESTFNVAALDDQVKIADQKNRDQLAKMPGMRQ